MEIVVLSSDIARLVLDYLKSQKLKKAIRTFCKTSPYLKQEFSAYRQGLQTHSFFPELEEIICEYVKIARKVEQLLPKLNDVIRSQLQHCKLSEKVNELLEHAFKTLLDTDIKTNSPAVPSKSFNIPNEQEVNNAKRKRSFETSYNSANDEMGNYINRNKRHKLALSRLGHCKKKSVPEPYCFLSVKALQRHKRFSYMKSSSSNTDEDIEEDENEEDSLSVADIDGDENDCCDGEIFGGGKPTKQSTPRVKSNEKAEHVGPILPEISQVILDNPEFQQKLVENINQALSQTSSVVIKNSQKCAETNNQNVFLSGTPPAGEEISSSQILDKMIKNILDATEKEPSFDAVIQEVVEASSKPQVQSTAIQCNINSINLPIAVNSPLCAAVGQPPLMSANAVTQVQQYESPISPTVPNPTTTTRNIFNISATNVAPPRTPILLRSTTGAAIANNSLSSATSLSAQDPPTILASNSFGPLMDPNFSISKLIVVNSNDSGQKQIPENCIGNTTADNLLGQLSTTGIVDHTNDEQVYFDTTTGQLTFPVFLTNEGLLTNFPFLINNEYVNQQLQSNTVCNMEGSRLEIPLSEPIVVTANQLPPNSIILSSSQKENTSEKQGTAEKVSKGTEIKHCNTVPPTTLGNRLLYDKGTPFSNVNTKAFKSLSTPRKRTSHVRALTFSPRDPQSLPNGGTPLSSRRETFSRFSSSIAKPVLEEISEKINEITSNSEQHRDPTSEKAIIKTVEILSTIENAAGEALKENANISSNETGNIPPLFVSEESSNQTIINKNLPVSEDVVKTSKPIDLAAVPSETDSTPKRKQFRKTAARSCKRQLSKTLKENNCSKEKPEKENEKSSKSTEKDGVISSEKNMMDEWFRLRNSNVDIDVRLREINASSQSQQTKRINTKKRVRRRKPAAIKKKEKEMAKKAEELERMKQLGGDLQDKSSYETQKIEQNIHSEIREENSNVVTSEQHHILDEEGSSKSSKTPKSKKVKRDELEKNVELDNYPSHDIATNQTLPNNISEALECEKRTANIAFLLETPLKDACVPTCNPPTPGIFAPSLETPASKLTDLHDEMQASSSFLFGSITKSELDTPITSVITPGFRLTPFGLKDIGTPKSVPGTDYSSGGGSYYKPDEGEDLDRNINKMLRNSEKKKLDGEEEIDNDNAEQVKDAEIVEQRDEREQSEETKTTKIQIEIPVEKLKVEPIVLKRVKSLVTENIDCLETAAIDPHYTLVSGLPEISAAEEECSSSSSSSSGSSFNSSSSSSKSSSSSSSSSSPSSSSKTSVRASEMVPPNEKVNINDLQNLSDISSTEDEEWQKLVVTDNDDNSQLVNNNGEVRYPVRSWLTPLKENIVEANTITESEIMQNKLTKPATIKVTVPLKSVEKRNKQVKELELKKQRIKEKLKTDATVTKRDKLTSTSTIAPNISAALAASRVMHAMRDKGKKLTDSSAVETADAVQEKRSLDVLTALNLSAKKNLLKTPENFRKTSRLLQSDVKVLTNTSKNSKEKITPNVSPSMAIKNTQRKCLPIEARPVTRTIQKTGKKIVRTPLAFKVIHSPGKINSHSTTTTLLELAATKTVVKNKVAVLPVNQQALRVSPRLMKTTKLESRKSFEAPAPNSRVNTRNAKSKTTQVSKPTLTRLRNHKEKKSTEPPLEKEMKELLEDCEDNTLETKQEEFKNEQKPAPPLKPKIHLKARNAMISNKTNTLKKQCRTALQLDTKEIKNKVLSHFDQQNLVVSASENADLNPPSTVLPPTKNDGDCLNDEDPLEDCEITTINESDANRFIRCVYSGPDGPPTAVTKAHDFSNFQMVVSIDENENHIWRITEGICLFSSVPNVPKPFATSIKKRKVRTVTTTVSENSSVQIPTKTMISNEKITISVGSPTDIPKFTSTPVAFQASGSSALTENNSASRLPEDRGSEFKSGTKQRAVEESNKSLPETNNDAPKIQIEDIESILSHLHGT